MRDLAAVVAAALLSSCATPRSRPDDLSAVEHDRRAEWMERMAATRGPGKDADEANFLARMAADHRRAAVALRDAEEKACTGLPPEERAADPFGPSRVVAVEPLDGADRVGDVPPDVRGALVRLLPREGETPDVLKARVECAFAHGAVIGFERKDPARPPYSVPGVSVSVRPEPNAPVVELRTEDPRNAKVLLDALRRAQARG